MKKVLLFSALCKPNEILKISLNSFVKLDKENYEVDFLFYDDNTEVSASEYLKSFCKVHSNCTLMPKSELDKSDYKDHNWNYSRINRIIKIKNDAIKYTLDNHYDYLFLVDADLLLHPKTLSHLFSLNKNFVFEIFWTLFFNESYYKPNAWDVHSWAYKGPDTILKLTNKGTFKIGGGGACTLISNEILFKGLNFNKIISLPYNGEDRHFCTRAQALGYDVYVDTHFPCYHIFDDSQIEEAKEWYMNGASPAFFNSWLNENWKVKVINSFTENKNFFGRVKSFQYELRRSIINSFNNNFKNQHI